MEKPWKEGSGKESSRQREQLVQRSWGGNDFGMLKKQVWSPLSEPLDGWVSGWVEDYMWGGRSQPVDVGQIGHKSSLPCMVLTSVHELPWLLTLGLPRGVVLTNEMLADRT